jgi:hypothetical protein
MTHADAAHMFSVMTSGAYSATPRRGQLIPDRFRASRMPATEGVGHNRLSASLSEARQMA